MATPTLVETPGATNANSYLTVAEADTYHDSRLHSSVWTSATTPTKTVALIMATRLLDRMVEWENWPTTEEQALEWPRDGMRDAHNYSFIENTVIPQLLKEATAEFARQLIGEDRTSDSDIDTQGITSLKAGPVSLTFKDLVIPKVVPDAVMNLIPDWWGRIRGRRSGTLQMLRA